MTPTEKDVEKAREILKGSYYENYEETPEVVSMIAQALADQREQLAKQIESVDVLSVLADWENGDDIAYAVQREIASKIRKGE